MRKVGTAAAEIDSAKIIEETEDCLVVPATIAREGVFLYPEGMAFKPADELKKAAWTAEGAWVLIEYHPDSKMVMNPDDVKGRVEKPFFCDKINGIKANLRFFKTRVDPTFLADIKAGKRKDVSIGFFYDEDRTPGEFKGQNYDFVQRNLLIDHVAAGVPKGRCPSPYCGITADAISPPKIEVVFPPSNRTPEEELERTRRLLHPQPEFKSTVGDLSKVTAERNSPRRVRQELRAMRDGHSIGDLSVVTAEYDSIENELQRKRAEADGLTAGDLFKGRRATDFKQVQSESQKILEAKYAKDAKAKDMRFLVENPSELEKRAAEVLPKIRATLAEAEKRREEEKKEAVWRDVEDRLRAKGIKV